MRRKFYSRCSDLVISTKIWISFQMFVVFSFLFVFFSPLGIYSNPPAFSRELNLKNGVLALQSLQRLLNFFESDAKSLNVDGLYGLRIGQGQLNALKEILAKPILLTDQNHQISSLAKQIERIANISLTQIEQDSSTYLHQFALIIYQPFVTEYRPRKILKHLIESGDRSDEFDEDESDKCFGQLLGRFEIRANHRTQTSFLFLLQVQITIVTLANVQSVNPVGT